MSTLPFQGKRMEHFLHRITEQTRSKFVHSERMMLGVALLLQQHYKRRHQPGWWPHGIVMTTVKDRGDGYHEITFIDAFGV